MTTVGGAAQPESECIGTNVSARGRIVITTGMTKRNSSMFRLANEIKAARRNATKGPITAAASFSCLHGHPGWPGSLARYVEIESGNTAILLSLGFNGRDDQQE